MPAASFAAILQDWAERKACQSAEMGLTPKFVTADNWPTYELAEYFDQTGQVQNRGDEPLWSFFVATSPSGPCRELRFYRRESVWLRPALSENHHTTK